MRYSIYIEMEGGFDSKMLYTQLKPYHFNVTDMKDKVYVYGECNENTMSNIFVYCANYGSVKATIQKIKEG